MRQRAFGRRRPFNQMRGRGRLGDARRTFGAGVFGAHGRYDPYLRGEDVDAFRSILPDAAHLTATAGTSQHIRFNDCLDTRQISREGPEIALRLVSRLAGRSFDDHGFLGFGATTIFSA